MAVDLDISRLEISRVAVELILERGLAAVTVEDIAARSGRSARTIWRHFGSKEGCVAPLMRGVVLRFIDLLTRWPLSISIETFISGLRNYDQTEEENRDDFAAIRIIALLPYEPSLRPIWLVACAEAEPRYLTVVARRSGRADEEFDVRLCAATTLAAMRLFYEELSSALVTQGKTLSADMFFDQLAKAIRAASTLPICDPITPSPRT